MRRILATVAAVTLGAAWSTVGAPPASAATTPAPTYVAMGDSLSAGEGTYSPYLSGSDTSTDKCHRSPMSFAVQYYLTSISNWAVTNVACSGAGTREIHNVFDPNTGNIRDLGELPQDRALSNLTNLVTISIGINDLGLLGFASDCYNQGDLTKEDSCFKSIESLPAYQQNLSLLPGKLHSAFEYIRGYAPNATIAVLTYPQIYPSTYTGDCQSLPGFVLVSSQGMLTTAQRVLHNLNTVIIGEVNNEIASHNHFLTIDIENALAGHDVCASDRWANQVSGINPFTRTVDPESLHPNTLGYQAIAKVIAKRLDAGFYPDGTVNQSIINAYNTYGGPAGFGFPADNGGGIYAHYWDGPKTYVQDYTNGSFGPSILVQGTTGSYLVNYGFRDAYIGGNWNKTCLAPLSNAYASGGGLRQDFVNCYMTWTTSTGVVVHGPNPNTCTDYGGTTTTGPNACVGFYTTSVWFSGGGIGLRGQEIWTYANGSVRDSTANYTLHGLDPTHAYTLQAFIPNGHSNASHAHYHYCGTNGGCAEGYVNQNNFTNAWATFGTVCTSDGNATIMLADDGGDRYPIQVGADAIRAVHTGLLC